MFEYTLTFLLEQPKNTFFATSSIIHKTLQLIAGVKAEGQATESINNVFTEVLDPRNRFQELMFTSMVSKQGSFNSYPFAHEDETHWCIWKKSASNSYTKQSWTSPSQQELPDVLLNVCKAPTAPPHFPVSPHSINCTHIFDLIICGLPLVSDHSCRRKMAA